MYIRGWFAVVIGLVIVTGTFFATREIVHADFENASKVRAQFDSATDGAITRLQQALAEVQSTYDPKKEKMDVLAFVESRILELNENEKIDKTNDALNALHDLGIDKDSDVAKSIIQQVFKQETVPMKHVEIEVAPLEDVRRR